MTRLVGAAARELEIEEMFELTSGEPPRWCQGKSCFADEAERAAAWRAHREDLISRGPRAIPGQRCWGWWRYEAKTEPPRTPTRRSSPSPPAAISNRASWRRWSAARSKPPSGPPPATRSRPTGRPPPSTTRSSPRCRMSSGDPDQPPRRRRSIYERQPSRRPPRDASWVVNPRTARIIGWLGEDGEVIPLPACCEDPLSCERPSLLALLRGWGLDCDAATL
jgi:hypothetical protein